MYLPPCLQPPSLLDTILCPLSFWAVTSHVLMFTTLAFYITSVLYKLYGIIFGQSRTGVGHRRRVLVFVKALKYSRLRYSHGPCTVGHPGKREVTTSPSRCTNSSIGENHADSHFCTTNSFYLAFNTFYIYKLQDSASRVGGSASNTPICSPLWSLGSQTQGSIPACLRTEMVSAAPGHSQAHDAGLDLIGGYRFPANSKRRKDRSDRHSKTLEKARVIPSPKKVDGHPPMEEYGVGVG